MILWSSFDLKPEVIVNCGELMPAFIHRRELLKKQSSFVVLDMLVLMLSDNGIIFLGRVNKIMMQKWESPLVG